MDGQALTPDALTSLSAAETQLRELRSSGAVFGLLDVDDEFFIVLRPAPSGTQLLISDATAAIDYDIAADVLDALHIEIPDIDRTTSTMSNPGKRVICPCWPIWACRNPCSPSSRPRPISIRTSSWG